MTIVRATLAQFDEALVLLEEYYAAVDVVVRDTPEQVRAYLTSEDAGIWLAYVEDAPGACVVLRPLPQMERAVECKRLYVRPVFRGCGVAHQLMDTVEGWARTAGLDWIYLDSKDDLPDAIRLYRGRGYVDCERYNCNPQATIFLRLALRGKADR